MPNTNELLQSLDRWGQWLHMCIGMPMTAPVCRPMWEWVMYIGFAIAAITFLWVLWKYVDYKLKYAAAIRAQIERERIAEPEEMAHHFFTEGADINESDVTDPHLAGKIRAELEKQRLARTNAPSKD